MRPCVSLVISLLILISSCNVHQRKQESISEEDRIVGSIISRFDDACLNKEKDHPLQMDVNKFLKYYKGFLEVGAPIIRKRLKEEITESQIDEMIVRYSKTEWEKGTWNIPQKRLLAKSRKKCKKKNFISISNIFFNEKKNKALCYAEVSDCSSSEYSMWILSLEENGWVAKRSLPMGVGDSFSKDNC